LFRLLYRFYDPTSGTVYIDEQNIQNVTLSSLRKEITVVPQGIFFVVVVILLLLFFVLLGSYVNH
jgi:ABC-type multidrug transport system fused ATPase/permease subunit